MSSPAAVAKTHDTVDVSSAAKQRLAGLFQKDEFARYADFIAEYILLARQAKWDDGMTIFNLQSKVNNKIRTAIGMQAKVPADNDLPGWLELVRDLATRKEQEAFAASLAKQQGGSSQPNGGRNYNNNNSGGNNNTSKEASNPGEPMDLGHISFQERNRRMENNLCMYCGDAGHFRATCPIAPAMTGQPAGRSRGGGRGGRGGGNRGGAPTRGSY